MRFLIKFSVFCLLLATTYFILIHKLSKGYVDEYYNKFTQEAGSLIIGASRAQQGISPTILENELKEHNFNKPVINFAFDGFQSPYGEVYFNAIKKKSSNIINNGLFILSVSPASFTAFTKDVEMVLNMDKKMRIGKVDNFSSNPNYNYIMKCYESPLYNSFLPTNTWKHALCHTNGWNEIKIKKGKHIINEADIKQWKKQTLDGYNKKLETEVDSKYRLNSFLNTIKFLKNKGTVVIIRIPADSDFIAMENNLWKNFNSQIDSIAKKHEVPYFNYSNEVGFKTYDGSHLESESAKKLTKLLSKSIKSYLNNDFK
ncbi:hypothetical protein A8C32_03505 [Flavivirga aquatica]|uniref:Uncharacterized protein n=1 Tax=Flavivirga aquatica TaxID=1849968 RepID=A0A1E5TAX8_9FLAO|nr:hypothetical protein [Flavivirga aquatica]OEK08532.1 hypothetical protein A8C32_03505 [Flavivirga aquatica]